MPPRNRDNKGAELPRAPEPKRLGKQLGHRIPTELHARLVACAEETGISQQTLLVRGLDKELQRHGF